MQLIVTKEKDGKTVKVYRDEDPESPRTWDTFGTIVYKKGSKYLLGDADLTSEEMNEIINNPNNIAIPVFAYIHGSVMLKARNENPFNCPWDSGQSGFVYVDRARVIKEFGDDSEESIEKAKNFMISEVDTFSQWLNGEVYGFVMEVNGEETDSCWGFYDDPENLADLALAGEV